MSETMFPNLASNPRADEIVRGELDAAGINARQFYTIVGVEVPTTYIGECGPWGFRRAWRYWIAEGPGIPPNVAEALHDTHGRQVRVDGHCGCPSPRQWFKGFAVGLYHVDTPAGLKALADAIKSVLATGETAE